MARLQRVIYDIIYKRKKDYRIYFVGHGAKKMPIGREL